MKPTKLNQSLSDSFLNDVRAIIEQGRQQAYIAVANSQLVTFWNIGRRIVEEDQNGSDRAKYGSHLLLELSKKLQAEYGTSYSDRNLRSYRQFYLSFRDMKIWNELVPNLTWTHIRKVLPISSEEARIWYLRQASQCMWSTETLGRNIASQYYERRLAYQRENSEQTLPAAIAPFNEKDPLEYIKNPTIAEFMGLSRDTKYNESQLEQALIDNLEKFILELGRGFAFVERQQHIATDLDDFYIDLVFYNFRMKRFVIFELKTHEMTHADVGQLDMYVRMYDDIMKADDDNPTIGVLLCTDTSTTIARYSVLNDSQQLFAAKYMTYMPTEDELRREIDRQKQFFIDHHKED